jgi:hypothetical protein
MSRKALLLIALIPLAACNKGKGTAPAQPATPGAVQAAGLKGTVLERLEAAPYTYLRLKTAQGEIWTAVPTTDAAVGSEVSFLQSMEQTDWDSPKLKRKFDKIFLGTLAPAATGMATPGAAPGAHPPVPVPAPTVEVGKIAKFEGPEGRTVAEIYAQRATLSGKTVAVRGRVMKVTAGIQVAGIAGATWVHIQDGSGNSAKADHDLTVTTDDPVAAGDLVVARGTLQADPKIGTGYERALLLKGAKITK